MGKGWMIMKKGILELFFYQQGRHGGVGRRRLCFQKLGIMDQAKGAVVVLQLFAVEVLVVAAGVAGKDSFVGFQQVMGIPHAHGQDEEQEQTQAPYQAVCSMP